MAEIGELAACFNNTANDCVLNLGIFTGLDDTNKARILDEKGEHIKDLLGDVFFVGNQVILTLKREGGWGDVYRFPYTSFIVCEITSIDKEKQPSSVTTPKAKPRGGFFKVLPVAKPAKPVPEKEHVVLTLKIKKGIGPTKEVFSSIEGQQLKLYPFARDRWSPLVFEIKDSVQIFDQFKEKSTETRTINYSAKLALIPKVNDWVYFFTPAGKLKTMYECGSIFVERSKRTDSCSLKIFSKDIHTEGKSFTVQPGRKTSAYSTGLSFALPYKLETAFHKEAITMDKLEY